MPGVTSVQNATTAPAALKIQQTQQNQAQQTQAQPAHPHHKAAQTPAASTTLGTKIDTHA